MYITGTCELELNYITFGISYKQDSDIRVQRLDPLFDKCVRHR